MISLLHCLVERSHAIFAPNNANQNTDRSNQTENCLICVHSAIQNFAASRKEMAVGLWVNRGWNKRRMFGAFKAPTWNLESYYFNSPIGVGRLNQPSGSIWYHFWLRSSFYAKVHEGLSLRIADHRWADLRRILSVRQLQLREVRQTSVRWYVNL